MKIRIAILMAVGVVVAMTGGLAQGETVAYWRFDNDGATAGGTAGTVLDETTNDNDGTGVNAPTYSSDVFGNPVPQTSATNGLSMDLERDSSQYISVPDNASLDFGHSSFTIEAYVKFETLATSLNTCKVIVHKKSIAGIGDKFTDYGMVIAAGGKYGAATNGELAFTLG